MTELEVLQEISGKLTGIKDGIDILIYVSGVMVGLYLILLFSQAWGRNT